jgi:replicative DNA helicase
MTAKSTTESLSTAIIERCLSFLNSKKKELEEDKPEKVKKVKEVAAVFIDYVQKLSTEEERVNRQQEIQRICQTLLTTALDKRVTASIILGSQVNREVISFDTLNLDNMREAGDIEQDANLVLGVWNDQAGKMDSLLKRLGEIERDLQEAGDQTKPTSDKKYDIKKLTTWKDNIKDMIKALQNPPPNTPNTLKIKVLKNRNGQNNGVFELNGYLDRYLIEDTLDTKVKLAEASKNNN